MSIQSMPSIQGASPPLAPQATTTQRTTAANERPGQAAQTQAAKADDTANTASADGKDVDAKELASAIEKVQDFTQTVANELKFSIDEDSGQTVVKIVDSATNEVIRQIPSKEMLAIAKALDQIQGLLIKQKV